MKMKSKNLKCCMMICVLLMATCMLLACGNKQSAVIEGAVNIVLSDSAITVDGAAVASDVESAVYTANDIVYYESGKDFTYGEGSEADAHSQEEADAHTVVHITKPGTYSVSGTLSRGQIAVDLGADAKDAPKAVVTLILNGVDITCEVAPAVIFYNVYECGSDDVETATKDVDTSAAGANVIIADGTTNTVNGSYVERIYKPESVVLNEDGTEVEDAKKLHKYDAAFYSKMTMNVNGDKKGTGVLNIHADNEGLDSELHLTINGGNINIYSGNDGINTNEDGVSVTTVNGGTLTIKVTGKTGEGDGIDSNGWLVINGGTVIASACANSADAGIDSDMGIYINGGIVIASGHMLDSIEENGQTYVVFNFMQGQDGSEVVKLKNKKGKAILETAPENSYSILVYSSPELSEGSYTLWSDKTQLSGQTGSGMMGGFGMQMMPGGFEGGQMPEGFEGGQMPGGFEGGQMPGGFEDGQMPGGFEGGQMPEGFEGGQMPEGFEGGEMPGGFEGGQMPEGFEMPEGQMPSGGMQRPEGGMPSGGMNFGGMTSELSADFEIKAGANNFMVSAQTEKKN